MVLMGVYFVVVAVGIAHHEMWRDELQAWMLARDSSSIPELLHNMRYEGHPAAWHILLFLLSRFTRDPVAMQLLHLALATAAVFVVVRWSPFSTLQKTLLTFGYFSVYEYAVISRGYILGALTLFTTCAVFSSRKRGYLPIALLLALLANTSAYGLILAFSLGVTLLAEWVTDRHFRADFGGARWDPLLALVLAVMGGIAAMVQMIPPPDAAFGALPSNEPLEWSRSNAVGAAYSLATVWRAYIPVPLLSTPYSWNSNLLVDLGYQAFLPAVLLSAVLLTGTMLLLVRSPYARLLFVLGSGGIIAFTYLRHYGDVRHHGHLFLLLVGSLWIARVSAIRERHLPPFSRLRPVALSWRNHWLTGILIAQLSAGTILYLQDLRKPFSMAQQAAKFLHRSGLGALPVVGSPSAEASAVAGYLDREIFYLEDGRFGTFVVWGQGRDTVPSSEVVERASPLLTEATPALLLVLRDSLPRDVRGPAVRQVAYFPPGILQWERYYLYLVQRDMDPNSQHGFRPSGFSQSAPPPTRIFAQTGTP